MVAHWRPVLHSERMKASTFYSLWCIVFSEEHSIDLVHLLHPWQDIASDLRSKRAAVTETEQNLRLAKGSCDTMAAKFQEHCPDIERQEADVQKLNKRFNLLNRQIDTRLDGQEMESGRNPHKASM